MTLPGGSGARIGYARVSTPEQDMSLQIDALERAGCSRIFQAQSARSCDFGQLKERIANVQSRRS
ncbi:recombinase family protein [Croceicoccus sp. YJ47]|uniref:recombinase family protein n=1 Tax=Croceicoccus sp. YJ47 TaxID=2798724 RepID=UPI001921C4F3|nr:recombinase family protein [Croceicoccus sp. YJ47]QQN75514.1 recombinase family protein [Croceicoccus sp. YJ47]